MTAASAALDYRQRGLSVIPIVEETKKPPVGFTWKRLQRTPATEKEIRKWWTRWPNANVGIITGAVSGIIALDGDGVDGVRHLTALGTTAFTPLVRTPRGGLHQIFKHPGGRIGSRAGVLPNLDVRGDGGYVVAPPSLRADGTGWTWLTTFDDFEPAELPGAVLAMLLETQTRDKKSAGPIPYGERDTTLYRLGRKLHAQGLDADDIEEALLIENAARCVPPWTEAEVRTLAVWVDTQEDREDFSPPDAVAAEVRAYVEKLRHRAKTWPWPPRIAASCSRVLEALLYLMARSGRRAFGASLREVAELSGLSKSTVKQTLRFLISEGWLTLQKGAPRRIRESAIWEVHFPTRSKISEDADHRLILSGIARWPVREKTVVHGTLIRPTPTTQDVPSPSVSDSQPPTESVPSGAESDAPLRALWDRVVSASAARTESVPSPTASDVEPPTESVPSASDLWCRSWKGKKGLGGSAGRLYATLSLSEPQKPRGLALLLGCGSRAVRLNLDILKGHGLAVRSEAGWCRGDANLDAVAVRLGVAGRGEVIRAEHQKQRNAFDEGQARGWRLEKRSA